MFAKLFKLIINQQMRAAPITRGKLNSWCVWRGCRKTIKHQFRLCKSGCVNYSRRNFRKWISLLSLLYGYWISGDSRSHPINSSRTFVNLLKKTIDGNWINVWDFQSPCCGKIYSCRFCHDDSETHTFNRKQLEELICTECETRQKVQINCEKCGVRFGKYTCLICNLFDDDDKSQYHCESCGICRVGGKDRFFHCEVRGKTLALIHARWHFFYF